MASTGRSGERHVGHVHRLLPDRDVRVDEDRSLCVLLGVDADGGAGSYSSLIG